jgi:hypothetical protein
LIKVVLSEYFAEALKNAGREITQDAIRRVEGAMADLGEDTFQQAKVMALASLDKTAQQYVDALDYRLVAPGVSVITLGPEAAHLELGYDSFDLKTGLLKNVKPGGPGKVSRAGYRYRAIPFTHEGKGKEGSGQRQMWSDLRQMKKLFGIDKTTRFGGPNSSPVLGKAAVISRDSIGGWSISGPSIENRNVGVMPWSANLAGVVKYQYQTRGGNVKSHYVTFRMVSENPKYKGKWIHPGFSGIHAFPKLQEWAIAQMSAKIHEALNE